MIMEETLGRAYLLALLVRRRRPPRLHYNQCNVEGSVKREALEIASSKLGKIKRWGKNLVKEDSRKEEHLKRVRDSPLSYDTALS